MREPNGAISRHDWWTIGRSYIAIEEIAPEVLLLLRSVPEHSLR